MSDLVEKVARAIVIEQDRDPDTLFQHLGDDFPVDATDVNGRTFYKCWRKKSSQARAAIAAVIEDMTREPSADVTSAGFDVYYKQGGMDDIFRAMLTAYAAENGIEVKG